MKLIPAMVLFAVLPLAAAEPVRTVLFPFRETVVSSQLESRVMPYKYRVGQRFKKGDVLVNLEAERFELEHKRALDQYEFSKAAFENRKKLHERNFTSDFEVKKAEFEYKTAENALAEAQLRLKYCSVTAPFDGKIQEITTGEYEITRPGQPLCRIIDDNHLLAVMNIPIADRKLAVPGCEVKIKIDSGKIVSGTVYEVSPQADHRTGTLRIRVIIDNNKWNLTAGSTGELDYGK